jgi:hypothetical protein
MSTGKRTRTPGRSAKVLKVLQANRGREMHIGDIAEVTELSLSSVSGAVTGLKRNFNIENPRRGWYRYNGSNTEQVRIKGTKAQIVSMLADDRLLLEVEGRLYIGYELDIK